MKGYRLRTFVFQLWLALIIGFLFVQRTTVAASNPPPIVVFSEAGFPSVDSAAPSPEQLKELLPNARFAALEDFRSLLKDPTIHLIVLPYGSAFPEAAWEDIFEFLKQGGNLLVLGGRPFTRAAYHESSGWKVREYSVRFAQQLRIDQYQAAPGSEGLTVEPNPDVVLKLPSFSWRRAFSPVIRLSAVDLYQRGGSAGSIDSRLDAVAWGSRDGRRLAAPALQIDHLRNGFTGGRWIFLNADLDASFYGGSAAKQIVAALAEEALRGSEDFTVCPVLPLYLHDEPIEIQVGDDMVPSGEAGFTARITVKSDSDNAIAFTGTVTLPRSEPVILRIPNAKGLYVIQAEMFDNGKLRAVYHSGFWIRDEAYLRSGPRFSVDHDYLELDGKPLAVVGTTYMSSDVQRLYFEHPNVYVWNRDLAQIHDAGLNMLRTGWWTGWDKFYDENGKPYERTLRTLEAYLMTARKNNLPVQFTFFAFLPDVLGGANAYLDPDEVRKEATLIGGVTARFHDVPFLAWDLINEPSFSQYLWRMRPNGDAFELRQWNAWLHQRYPDRAALAAAWDLPEGEPAGPLPVPTEAEFDPRGMYNGTNSLKLYDFFLFAQDTFADWAKKMRNTIRETGANQPITVGQDEGGYVDRLSPAFFGAAVDFTTNHSWWQNDALLWDSLVAKQPGLPLLIQETGNQRELTLDEIARRKQENDAALFERKVAMSFVGGSGAIEWLWNTNSYMTASNEVPIGALRADETEKPEAMVMRAFAAFSKSLSGELRDPQMPEVAILTSQAEQFSVLNGLQVEAQQNAVRALSYFDRVPCYVIAENQVEKLGSPKLVILPSPQALSDRTWRALLDYVTQGGNLLITGPVAREVHWHRISRAADLQVDSQVGPLTTHDAVIRAKDQVYPLAFDQNAQSWLECLHFADGSTFKQIPHGKGRIFWASFPLELATSLTPAAAVYSAVLEDLGVTPPFELHVALSPGILIYPMFLKDATLYVFESESADEAEIDLTDKHTGSRLTFRLPSQHAALALIRNSDGKLLAKYGFQVKAGKHGGRTRE
jgi:hypothetical protein